MNGNQLRTWVAAVGLASVLALSGCTDPAVSDAMKAIDAIGEVTLESTETIETANEKYDALDSEKKEQVENYELLKKANKRIIEVENEAKCLDAITAGLQSRLDTQDAEAASYSERAGVLSGTLQEEKRALGELSTCELGSEFEGVLTDYITSLEN